MTMLETSRAGRPRKQGLRHKSGDLVRSARAPDDRIKTSRQPHRRSLPEALRLDERAGTVLGRLYLRGRLSEPLFDAGTRWAVVVGEMRAAIEPPAATSGSGRGYDCDASLCHAMRGDLDYRCECAQRTVRYNEAFCALMRAGRRALVAVNRAAIEDLPPWPGELPSLIAGLEALAWHFHRARGYQSAIAR